MGPDVNKVMKPATLTNHPPAVEVPPDNHPLVAPVYQSVKFEFDSVGETGERITLLLEDYRNLRGQFDKIVSIELTAWCALPA